MILKFDRNRVQFLCITSFLMIYLLIYCVYEVRIEILPVNFDIVDIEVKAPPLKKLYHKKD